MCWLGSLLRRRRELVTQRFTFVGEESLRDELRASAQEAIDWEDWNEWKRWGRLGGEGSKTRIVESTNTQYILPTFLKSNV